MAGGREERVQTHSQRVLKHDWNYPFEQGAVDLQTWVVVDFDQPRLEVPIDHKIESKDLKVVLMSAVVDDLVVRLDDVGGHFFNFGQNISVEVVVFGGVAVVEVPLEFRVRNLVSRLELLIVFRMFLDGVVGEVNELVVDLLQVEHLARCSDVSLLIPIGLDNPINAGQHHEMSDVKLSIIVKEGSIDVGLDDVGERLTVLVLGLPNQLTDTVKRGQLYPSASVRVLARFHNPHLVGIPLVLLHKLFELVVFRRSYVVSLGDEIERVPVLDMGEIVQQRPKEVFLGTDAIVPGEVVGDEVWCENRLEGNDVALLSYEVLYYLRLLVRHNLPIHVQALVFLSLSELSDSFNVRSWELQLLFLHLIDDVLAPAEVHNV